MSSTNQVTISKSSGNKNIDEQYLQVTINPMLSSSSQPKIDDDVPITSDSGAAKPSSAQDGGSGGGLESFPAIGITDLNRENGMANFNYRNVTNVSFALASKHSSSTHPENQDLDNKTYFSYKGEEIIATPENIGKVGSAQVQQIYLRPDRNASNQTDIEALQDDSRARIERLKQFDVAFQSLADPIQHDGDFEGCLFADEEITAVIECSQISGLPTYTSDVVVSGSSKLALTYSPSGEVRLLFSVLAESTSINVEESFVGNILEKGFTCCFVNCKTCYRVLPTWITCFFCCDCFKIYQSANSSAKIKYNSTSLATQQFFSVPVGPCLLDAVTYRERTNILDASHGSDGLNVAVTELTCCERILAFIMYCWNAIWACWKRFIDFLIWLLTCMAPYCGHFDIMTSRSVHFEASESKVRGDESEFDALLDQESQSGDIGFKISSVDDDEIYILIHYQSLLDFQNRTCKVKLARRKDKSNAELFKMAKRFVSTLSCNRSEYVKGRLFSKEMKPYEVKAIEGAKPGRLEELKEKKRVAENRHALGVFGMF